MIETIAYDTKSSGCADLNECSKFDWDCLGIPQTSLAPSDRIRCRENASDLYRHQ